MGSTPLFDTPVCPRCSRWTGLVGVLCSWCWRDPWGYTIRERAKLRGSTPPREALAHDAANRVKRDLMGRGGFDAWWWSIEPDIQDEIVEAWAGLIAAAFSGVA